MAPMTVQSKTSLQVSIDRSYADEYAKLLLAKPGVLAVQLFGSRARGEEKPSSDYDLIVVGDEQLYQTWSMLLPTNGDHYRAARGERFAAAQLALRGLPSVPRFSSLDLFIFPSDWQEDWMLERLQASGGHRDPHFMQNIAREAITFDPLRGSFPWP